MFFPIRLILALLFLAGVVLLQIFLSRLESRWPGLVLPGISLLFSLLYPLNMVAPPEGVTVGFALQLLLVWLIANIPTIILLAIYAAAREKVRKRKQIDKMNIQDLD